MNELREKQLHEQIEEGFLIDSLEKATWAIKKLKVIEEKCLELETIKDREINNIQKRFDKETQDITENKIYLENLLRVYYMENKKVDKKFKVSTPYGSISLRKAKKWIYEDEKQLIKYLRDSNNEELIRVKEEIDKVKLKQIFKDGIDSYTGEILPSIRIEEVESMNIKLST